MSKLTVFIILLLALVGTPTFGNCRAGVTYWVTNTGDSGSGSLRQAMIDANTNAGIDTIAFNIPGSGTQTILPDSALPTVTDTVVIDGYTQPGASPATPTALAILLIRLDGTNAAGVVDGLEVTAGGCTIRGLMIGSFSGNGITLSTNGGNRILGNCIGADVEWTQNFGNGQSGVHIECSNNFVGGPGSSDPNTIGYNSLDGVRVLSGVGNAILSNSTSNYLLGIDLGGDGFTDNDVGDTDTGANNLQNSPVIDYASCYPAGTTATALGHINSTPNTLYRIELFLVECPGPGWYGDGKRFLGSTDVSTDGSGNGVFLAVLTDTLPILGFLAATATDLTTNINDTSEIGGCHGILWSVELTSFTGRSDQETIRLEWVTLSEDENLGFHLYRSSGEDAVYRRITDELIPGAGTTVARHDYSYLDEDVEVGSTYYYKLADVDFEGLETMHGPVRVTVLPCEYRLLQNFPNPFRETTTMTFNLKADGHVRLLVHNLAGERVALLVDEPLGRGVHNVEWDGRNGAGHDLPSGAYTYTVGVNEFRSSRKMTLNR